MSIAQRDEISALNPDQKATALAISVLQDRLVNLCDEDRESVWKIIRSMAECNSDEERQCAQDALFEILDQEPAHMEKYDLETTGRPEGAKDPLAHWKTGVGAAVRGFRADRGLTQEELAEASGLPQSHISRIETARLSPSHVTIEKIAEALGVDPSEIDPLRS